MTEIYDSLLPPSDSLVVGNESLRTRGTPSTHTLGSSRRNSRADHGFTHVRKTGDDMVPTPSSFPYASGEDLDLTSRTASPRGTMGWEVPCARDTCFHGANDSVGAWDPTPSSEAPGTQEGSLSRLGSFGSSGSSAARTPHDSPVRLPPTNRANVYSDHSYSSQQGPRWFGSLQPPSQTDQIPQALLDDRDKLLDTIWAAAFRPPPMAAADPLPDPSPGPEGVTKATPKQAPPEIPGSSEQPATYSQLVNRLKRNRSRTRTQRNQSRKDNSITPLTDSQNSTVTSPQKKQTRRTPPSALVKCLQLNLKKSKIATWDMFSYAKDTHIFLLQEPWVYKDAPRGVPCHFRSFYKPPDPRAIVITDPSLEMSPCPEFAHRDLQVVLWNTHGSARNDARIMIISWYWDQKTKTVVTGALLDALAMAKRIKAEVVLSADSNAHSPAWGGTTLDNQGRTLEALLASNALMLLNDGVRPTFSGRGDTYIDITAVSAGLSGMARKWQCDAFHTTSDHKVITFHLSITANKQLRLSRSLRKADWFTFTDTLESYSFPDHLPTEWTTTNSPLH